jgi:hypothetical protein
LMHRCIAEHICQQQQADPIPTREELDRAAQGPAGSPPQATMTS